MACCHFMVLLKSLAAPWPGRGGESIPGGILTATAIVTQGYFLTLYAANFIIRARLKL